MALSGQFSFTFSAPGGRSLPQPPSDSPPVGPHVDNLCQACRLLDLESAFARAHHTYEDARRGHNNRAITCYRGPNGPPYLRDFYFVTSLGRRLADETTASRCKLCSFFRQHVTDPTGGTYKVLAICSSESWLFQPPRRDGRARFIRRPWDNLEYNVFLAVVPEVALIPKMGLPLRWLETGLPQRGAIYRLTSEPPEEEGLRLVLPNELLPTMSNADYWMDLCSNSHGSYCSAKKPPGATVDGFKAINCVKNPPEVEEISWREKYVALSYVWGAAEIPDWPQTTLDAIAVTNTMGYQYLWVDRLCIDQSNRAQKKYMLSKMDLIFEGAEFTIVNAAGVAATGLPGVGMTPRRPQPRVELRNPRRMVAYRPTETDKCLDFLNVPETEYDRETENHNSWLDPYRHGLDSANMIDIGAITRNSERAERYSIPCAHIEFYENVAGGNVDDYLGKMHELARRMGIPFSELLPYFHQESGLGSITLEEFCRGSRQPLSEATRPKRPLPPGVVPGRTILVSTMQDPRIAIRESRWATRGWTYEEGVLSRRCLIFTPEQVYWECRGMAVCESMDLALRYLHKRTDNEEGWISADYMLSGILRGDQYFLPEFQFGFQQDNDNQQDMDTQVKILDGHIAAYTSRELTKTRDAWNAFLGVAARYCVTNGDGLAMLLGIPILTGSFHESDRQSLLKHSFAMSLSAWIHVGSPDPDSVLYIANCARRAQFPSWSWIGWEGRVDFNGDEKTPKQARAEALEGTSDVGSHRSHIEFFSAMTTSWRSSIQLIWSADMTLRSDDGQDMILLYGDDVDLHSAFADADRGWALTIEEPLLITHLVMRWSDGRERQLVLGHSVNLSTPLTEQQLKDGYNSGQIASVLVFASTVPFVFTGKAQFLMLRQVDAERDRWERIGRLVLNIAEERMGTLQTAADLIAHLPVHKVRRTFTIV